MASDVFHTVNGAIYFQDIKSIDPEKQTIYSVTGTKVYIYNVAVWREFKAQYDTWKLEQKKMSKDTFRIRGYDYHLSDVIAFNEHDFTVSFEHTYENLTQEQFGDFLIAYGNWIKQRKKVVNYPDGWYKAKNNMGRYNVIRLTNNIVYHPKFPSGLNLNINDESMVWANIEPIDIMSNEFAELFTETIK